MKYSMDKNIRYRHVYKQLDELLSVTEFPYSKMATIVSVLYHKMDGFFWTGFYLLHEKELLVGPYQGPLACQKLKKDTGVCWESVNQKRIIIVPDVHKFPGHISCDQCSNAEIVVPVFSKENEIIAVLDIDSRNFNHFDETDSEWLNKIIDLFNK